MPADRRDQSHQRIFRTIEQKALQKRPLLLRMADRLTVYFGTPRFFLLLLAVTVVWIAVNVGWTAGVVPFDPYPFILLTMAASVGAIFMTVVILMSQNRQASINTLRSELLLQMILITERELTKALKLLARGRGKALKDRELAEMTKETNFSSLETQLERELQNNHME
ncbi:DUF1003 domain-containing protein [Candidatus Gottesmanbacteria bacterium]|nr:DUF1003 domain-containing protein [Candidatus Gottesmanbacteria bacterium]